MESLTIYMLAVAQIQIVCHIVVYMLNNVVEKTVLFISDSQVLFYTHIPTCAPAIFSINDQVKKALTSFERDKLMSKLDSQLDYEVCILAAIC